MNPFSSLGIGSRRTIARDPAVQTYAMIRRPLQRILALRGRSIDDVVNCSMVKNEVFGYWKLHKEVDRVSDIVDLERQWNGAHRPKRR